MEGGALGGGGEVDTQYLYGKVASGIKSCYGLMTVGYVIDIAELTCCQQSGENMPHGIWN